MLEVPIVRLDPDLAVPAYAREGDAGADLVASTDGRQLFVTGHPEYDRDTLAGEYQRDLAAGAAPAPTAAVARSGQPQAGRATRGRGPRTPRARVRAIVPLPVRTTREARYVSARCC